MYKHESNEYLPQHPMLVQIREEKELYNSLPESMKLGAENFMDVEELSSASEHFSDEEIDFEPSAGKKSGSKLAKAILKKSDLLKFVFNKAIGKKTKIKICFGVASSGNMDYELNPYAYEIYEALKKYKGKEKEAEENLVDELLKLDKAKKFKGIVAKSSATKHTIRRGGRKITRGCTLKEMKLPYLKKALQMAGCKNF